MRAPARLTSPLLFREGLVAQPIHLKALLRSICRSPPGNHVRPFKAHLDWRQLTRGPLTKAVIEPGLPRIRMALLYQHFEPSHPARSAQFSDSYSSEARAQPTLSPSTTLESAPRRQRKSPLSAPCLFLSWVQLHQRKTRLSYLSPIFEFAGITLRPTSSS